MIFTSIGFTSILNRGYKVGGEIFSFIQVQSPSNKSMKFEYYIVTKCWRLMAKLILCMSMIVG